jgi:glyoxylase-like metal-dependent hydrolase (beta-lactamase superfamily II)
LKLGSVDVEILNDGFWRADGGAMFGVVPRPLWERKLPPDERNRVTLALRCLLVRDGATTVLIDTGIGDKLSAKDQDTYGVERPSGLVTELARRGVAPADLDVVVNTHLHFDHAGGNTTKRGDEVVATYPRAEYWIQRREWCDAITPNERTRSTYLPENYRPIEAAGQLRLVDGATQVTPSVRWLAAPGHTAGHTCVLIESGGRSVLFTVDVCPFVAHLERLAWVPAVDVEPLVSMQTKRAIVADALAHDRLLVFDHDPRVVTARLTGSVERWQVEPVQTECRETTRIWPASRTV